MSQENRKAGKRKSKIQIEAIACHWLGRLGWPAIILVNGVRFTSAAPTTDKEERRINRAVLAVTK